VLILATGFLVPRWSKKLPPAAHQKTDRFLGEPHCEMAGVSPPEPRKKGEIHRDVRYRDFVSPPP
jgi:hypothetical protein